MKTQVLSLEDFNYHLPEDLIAQRPASPRDHSKLLIYNRQNKTIIDDFFYNLAEYLPSDTLLVLNNSKVDKVRLLFDNKEIFITRTLDGHTVQAMVRPGRVFRKGKTVTLLTYEKEHLAHSSPDLSAEVIDVAEDGLRTLRFNIPFDHPKLLPWRHTPFPPYIKADESLADNYQTIFAREKGSIAAPTAGLHFTERVLSGLAEQGINKTEITLHVGLGTFAPIKTDKISSHQLHKEWYRIPPESVVKLRSASHITAVGTTSARVLESAVNKPGTSRTRRNFLKTHRPDTPKYRDFVYTEKETSLFIKPGYNFQATDALITNFHLPKSTLLMMIAAFTSLEEVHQIYEHAIKNKYRFYSFGDAMLLL